MQVPYLKRMLASLSSLRRATNTAHHEKVLAVVRRRHHRPSGLGRWRSPGASRSDVCLVGNLEQLRDDAELVEMVLAWKTRLQPPGATSSTAWFPFDVRVICSMVTAMVMLLVVCDEIGMLGRK
jgi:hypothetical protein